ncbi:hypothetical protein [Stenotrophomonas sp. 24(2023)]|uniref:hypothetical protein n=1 Tax=Stenotrophomonas sp. 24(2023) TaxID=3068324 RepID=UPI0027E06EDC|nr:hypothetical protein [Stenotrophomonas sp. 24(2023)]WMJ71325.1 hypothetical protein Q9R17_09585 [Stenotrophomonas sp. 24(2023)]
MTAGIKIINDWGTVLIDDTFPTLAMVAQGTSTLVRSDNVTDPGGSAYIGNYSGVVAVRSSSVAGYQYFNEIDGYPAGFYLFGPAGAVVQWYVYAPPQEPPSNVGLIIRDGAGRLMFDAGRKAARVAGLRSASSRPGWQGTASFDGSRAWAVMPLASAIDSVNTFRRWGAPDEYYQYEDVSVSGGAVNGGTVTFGMTPSSRRTYGPAFGTRPPAGFSYNTHNAALAVIDVTNY